MYIDDGLLIGDISEDKIKEFEKDLWNAGQVCLAPSKSGFVKRDGEWKKPFLKFLGIKYDPEKEEMYASTRGGATIKAPKIHESQWRSLGISENMILEMSPLEQSEKLNLGGLILAFMYNDGKLGEHEEKDARKPKRNSLFTQEDLKWKHTGQRYTGSTIVGNKLLSEMWRIRKSESYKDYVYLYRQHRESKN